MSPTTPKARHPAGKEEFARLQERLKGVWEKFLTDPGYEHTSIIVPSLSVNQEELAKIVGSAYYEERLMFALFRLRNPNARLIYITSQPVNPEIVDYYLQQIDGVPVSHARRRLHMVSVYDASARPLSEKLLERPRLLEHLREQIDDPENAYLTCYNSTVLERDLAVELGVPLNGVDPDLLYYGTKSGSRRIFADTGVHHPAGYEDLTDEESIVAALAQLAEQRPSMRRALVKLNEGFAGEGNGILTYPEKRTDPASLHKALESLKWSSDAESSQRFLGKFAAMGGIVEEMVDYDEIRSPSVQMRIHPNGTSALVSTHEQVLGGATGQAYLGCRFPADQDYRAALQRNGELIGGALSEKGVIGRFGIDFLACRNPGEEWTLYAIEINLRMCGTTPPYHALEFLTGGTLDEESGLFFAPDGQQKFYNATDNLKSPAYRGLLPEDLLELMQGSGLAYNHATGTGVLFYMIGALSQYGKLGMTCIGNSPEEAQQLFERTVAMLDEETEGRGHGEPAPIFDRYLLME